MFMGRAMSQGWASIRGARAARRWAIIGGELGSGVEMVAAMSSPKAMQADGVGASE